jgi:hypothetical protein
VAQVVKYLPNICETLGSIPTTVKEKNIFCFIIPNLANHNLMGEIGMKRKKDKGFKIFNA